MLFNKQEPESGPSKLSRQQIEAIWNDVSSDLPPAEGLSEIVRKGA